ncbi:MAG: serine hydrolase domain-containing protein, partial [Bacteroidota bacterium]
MRTFVLIPLLLVFGMVFSQTSLDSTALTKRIQEQFASSNLPGFGLALVNGDEITYLHGFGVANRETRAPFTPQHIQNLGSVSKIVVGLAVVKAAEKDFLDMETPINDLLPFPITNPYHPESPILVKHLVTHTSSFTVTKFYGQTYVSHRYASQPGILHGGFEGFIGGHE